jgi:hypothetical protein
MHFDVLVEQRRKLQHDSYLRVLFFPQTSSGSPEVQDESCSETAPSHLDIQGEVVEADFSLSCLPVSTPVSLDDTTPILGSSVTASMVVRLLDDAFKDDYDPYGISGSPVGSLVSLDDTRPILGSSVMASTVVRLLDDAFQDDYDPYGISDSPVGSLVSLDDTRPILGSSVMASTVVRLLGDAFKDDYDPYGISGSPACSLVSLDDATPVASLPESTATHSQSDSSIYRFVICLILP